MVKAAAIGKLLAGRLGDPFAAAFGGVFTAVR